MSRIRADRVTNREGTGAPLFPNGIRVVGLTSLSNVVAGVTTFTSDVSIGGTLTYEDVTNIDSVGMVTARTGIKVLAGGINAVGVVTGTSFSGGGDNLTFTSLSATPYFPMVGETAQSSPITTHLNFGQDSSFAGNKTAQGNADENGIGDFYYSPPTGYLALCSSNLPDTTISPNQSTQADDHFDTIIYDGSASNQTITTNFQADVALYPICCSSCYA